MWQYVLKKNNNNPTHTKSIKENLMLVETTSELSIGEYLDLNTVIQISPMGYKRTLHFKIMFGHFL